MQVQPYLMFDGRCEEALEFYRKAVGAQITSLMRYKEMPEPSSPEMCPPSSAEKVMHSSFTIGEMQLLMASDGQRQGQAGVPGHLACLCSPPTRPEAKRCSAAPWAMAKARYRCRLARLSSPRLSAWWRTGSGSRGWWWW